MGQTIRYRSDIDGLRAVAVMPIVLFHSGLDRLSGGFVGVDVFYVISGYLITAIISREIKDHRFSVAAFYRRRAVRILPALLAMLLVTLAVSQLIEFPAERRALSASAAATLAFSSNIYFWNAAGYFSADAEFLPLLHTWSLGVEEQFYLFYPLLLLGLARRKPAALVPAIAGISGVSFAISWATSHSPDWSAFAFYMLPSRAWELGVGALAALIGPIWRFPRWTNECAAVLGLALICLATIATPAGSGFPAPWAIPACLGAALIIRCAELTLVGSLLSWRPVRWIGLTSYSIYIWHWPVIALYRYYKLPGDPNPTNKETVILTMASIAVGAISYYGIEQPFLKRFRETRPRHALASATAALLVALAACGLSYCMSERINRFPAVATQINNYLDYYGSKEFDRQFHAGSCFVEGRMQLDRSACLNLSTRRPNLLLAGDSVAADLRSAIDVKFGNVAEISQITSSNCHPVIGGDGPGECPKLLNWMFEDVVNSGKIDSIVLGGIWKKEEIGALVKTIQILRARGIEVTVLGSPLLYDRKIPLVASHAVAAGEPLKVDRYRVTSSKELSDFMSAPIRAAGANYVNVYRIECPNTPCDPVYRGGIPRLFDGVHVTPLMAMEIVAALSAPSRTSR